jgi:hypothetical protein
LISAPIPSACDSFGANVLFPVLEPDNVRLPKFAWIGPVLVKLIGPVPLLATVALPLTMENRRLVVLPVPVYDSVLPPPSTRLDAALVEAPMALGCPPSASVVIARVPLFELLVMVVGPV